MRETLESFGVAVARTGGLALIVLYPLIPFLLIYGGLMAAGRGIWGRGTETRQPKHDAVDRYLRQDY